ncbi:hypothetical protein CEXT_97641 [Caerostris extrusa]|uniref:Uncharacterized protein n=1 Tax=Caerostris extrusa TaxID=172846 RepID=A0AAV4XDX5_CAEEX|nr:hypothetical protein CEXT_97641 [Caerostris extrusa]
MRSGHKWPPTRSPRRDSRQRRSRSTLERVLRGMSTSRPRVGLWRFNAAGITSCISKGEEKLLMAFRTTESNIPGKGQMFINYNRGKGVRGGERGSHGSGTFGLLLLSVCVAGSRNRNRNEVGRRVWFRYERVSLEWLL